MLMHYVLCGVVWCGVTAELHVVPPCELQANRTAWGRHCSVQAHPAGAAA